MLFLMGIAYLVIGYVWDNKLVKAITITCEFFLLVINFLTENIILGILTIACILIPVLIARLDKEKDDENTIPTPE